MQNMADRLNIGIIGSGKMGLDIFNYLTDFDLNITLLTRTDEKSVALTEKFNKRLKRQLENNIINIDEYCSKLNNINITNDIKRLANSDIIIESIIEDIDAKIELFDKIDKVVNPNCIFTSNSSSIIPSLLCKSEKRKDKFLGLHFFYPVKLKNIVEIIKTDQTFDSVIDMIKKFLNKISKFSLELTEENAFILNKIMLDLQTIAYKISEEKILNYKQIDNLIKANIFPSGVFDFFDSVGIDVMYNSINQYIKDKKNKNFYIPLLGKLKEMMDNNKLGLKTKAGFYSYAPDNSDKAISVDDNKEYKKKAATRLVITFINSVYKAVEKKACTFENVEYSMKEYTGASIGPVELSKKLGIKKIYLALKKYYSATNNEIYNPSKLLEQ